jgi:uncharacterized protein (DUF58 family)
VTGPTAPGPPAAPNAPDPSDDAGGRPDAETRGPSAPRPRAPAASRDPQDAPGPVSGSRAWWAGVLPVPTVRTAAAFVGAALVSGFGPAVIGVWPPIVLVALLMVVDGYLAPAPWTVGFSRELPPVLPLDGVGEIVWRLQNPSERRLTVAIADELAPSLGAASRRVSTTLPARGRARVSAGLAPRRRGTFRPSAVTVRVVGPLGLATRQSQRQVEGRIEVHPSFRSRDAAELRIRRARILQEGLRSVRGRGGGTEFEALREYVQGDEFRHVDWSATARAGTPIVRTYRAERNQTVVVLLDTGRVVAGLVEDVPRLDHGMDATLALATVATALGDRVGMIAFGGQVRAIVPPRRDRAQLRRLSGAMHALEPELAESGYHDAFRTTLARFRRRALLVLVTELGDEAVQETLIPALPVITREHAVVIASVRDPALERLRDREATSASDAYAAAAAASVLTDRARAAARLRALGAHVVDTGPDELASALADVYLDVKARGRL